MLVQGFVCLQHDSYLLERFNRKPQGSGLGRTSRSAYIFLDNVVRMELRLFSRGLFAAYTTHNPTIFNRGLLIFRQIFFRYVIYNKIRGIGIGQSEDISKNQSF